MGKTLALLCMLLCLLLAGCGDIHVGPIDWQEVFTSRYDETATPQPEVDHILAAGRGDGQTAAEQVQAAKDGELLIWLNDAATDFPTDISELTLLPLIPE